MQKIVLVSIIAAACIRSTQGAFGIPDFVELGYCNNSTLKDDFDPIKYQGTWFNIQSVPNEYESAKQCNSMNYTWLDDRFMSVGKGLNEEGKKIKEITEMLQELELRDPPHPAHMTVSAVGVPEAPYEVISTDYVTYSCVYSCLEMLGFKGEFFWVLGRTPSISPHLVTHCHESLRGFDVDPNKLVDVSQGEHCPYMKRLDDIFEKNRQLLIKVGALNENAPPFAYEPPSPNHQETINEIEKEGALRKPELAIRFPNSGEGTVLEDPFERTHPDLEQNNSSPPSKTSNIAILIFILMAVL